LDKYGRICPLVLIVLSDTTLEMGNTSISHRSLPVLCGYLILLITPGYLFFLKLEIKELPISVFSGKKISKFQICQFWGERGEVEFENSMNRWVS
jgi:hypothetical protein